MVEFTGEGKMLNRRGFLKGSALFAAAAVGIAAGVAPAFAQNPPSAPPKEEPKAPEGEKKDEEKKDEEKKDDEPDKPFERREFVYGEDIFNINVSFDIGGRFFGSSDGLSTNLRDYSVFGTPGVSARAEVYPVAPVGIVVARDIGIHGEFRIAPVISSETQDGTEVDTEWMRFGGGLKYRFPIPGPEDKPFVLALEGNLGGWDYTAGLKHGWSERETKPGAGWVSVTGTATVGATGTTLFLKHALNPI